MGQPVKREIFLYQAKIDLKLPEGGYRPARTIQEVKAVALMEGWFTPREPEDAEQGLWLIEFNYEARRLQFEAEKVIIVKNAIYEVELEMP